MNYNETYEVFDKLFANELDEVKAKELLVSLYERGENSDEIAAAASVMKKYSKKVNVANELQDKLIDNCGTGGDKSGSFNISTASSILLASCGSYVAKHGNRSITSKSGSTDVLEAFGINLDISTENLPKMLEETNWMFMFAVNHHPAMKHIMPIRKTLAHRTIFNILGPLCNPADVRKQLIGVFDKSFLNNITQALKKLESKSAFVVSSNDGMDEVSISDITYFEYLNKNKVTSGEINPQDYGMKLSSFEEIKGGDAKENASIIYDIFSGEEKGPKRDIVLLNSAVALLVDAKVNDIKDGIEMAKENIENKNAFNKLKSIIKVSKKL
ncbi:MAG: Anthranilate phosphoribosyltransferase (EC [uncultured Campylobacterales bacterium]|uniref:Anthranilate phosphoribosyltransferase n=1 Tax=uncultured Campylobacterales bacterium TaxID=352960 RepID=A0A6S6T393_9BACT|nr:MAG: Anthranilate phosphoribosyltransferase (EC [uncultured Campylobacterales bacterium]